MTVVLKPKVLKDTHFSFCPGCTHGTAVKLVAESIDELNIQGRTIGVASVGCSYNIYNYYDLDFVQAPHGRAPAVATGVKRVNPSNVVFSYQGDGDLAAIGTAEIVHAAARGENITCIFINNAVYGMTSGQMAPTTLLNQVTMTCPTGRNPNTHGYPIRVCEMLATLEGATYIERVALYNVKNILNAKKAIKKAFQIQLANKGFSIVEILSSCPTNWGMKPTDALKWIEKEMAQHYPLGNFKGQNVEV